MPEWRLRVCFLPQDVPALLGSPLDHLREVATYRARKKRPTSFPAPGLEAAAAAAAAAVKLAEVAAEVGLAPGCLGRAWADLSGGERARASLAVALALMQSQGGHVLLLDEPTAALDLDTAKLVEVRHAAGP